MSGYLRSLTGHAVTPGPRLHPIASPLAGMPLSAAQRGPLELAAAIAAPVPDAERQQPGSASVTVADTPRKNQSAPRAPISVAEAVTLLIDPPARSRHIVPEVADEPSRRIDPARVHDERAPAAHSARASQRPDSERTTVAPAREGSPPSATPAPIKPLPTKPSSSRMAAPARITEQRSDATRRRQEPPPDVHIHIGRIELTAVTPPAPARRQQAAAKAAMPLGEYLQRRNGRAR